MKIVYRDLDRSSPRVTWQGVDFIDGVPVEVPDGFIRDKIVGNPFFEFLDSPKDGTEPAPAMKSGAVAPSVASAPVPRPAPKVGA